MHLVEIKETFMDYPDNESNAVIVFTSGCSHFCPSCYNRDLQDPSYGDYVTPEELANKIKIYALRANTNKLVFSGGDPLYNHAELIETLDLLTDFDICVYTGYDINRAKNYLQTCKHHPLYLKCGTFDETQRDPNSGKDEHKFILASKNQAFYKWDGLRNIYYPISKGNVLEFNDE